MELSIQIEGGDDLQATLANMGSEADDAVGQGIEQVAMALRDSMVQYAQAGHPEHPNVVTGRMAGSMTYVMLSSTSAQVGSNQTDPPYPAYLEYGTSRMQPYTWFMPAITDVIDGGQAQSIFSDVVTSALGLD